MMALGNPMKLPRKWIFKREIIYKWWISSTHVADYQRVDRFDGFSSQFNLDWLLCYNFIFCYVHEGIHKTIPSSKNIPGIMRSMGTMFHIRVGMIL